MSNFTDIKDMLFARGFALYPSHTSFPDVVWDELSAWQTQEFNGYILRHHPSSSVFSSVHQTGAAVLVGNAVNPFTGEVEEEIVNHLLKKENSMLEDGYLRTELIDYVDQLTGRFQIFFIENGVICALCDATGLAPLDLFYAKLQLLIKMRSLV